jgi:hypothetical protein
MKCNSGGSFVLDDRSVRQQDRVSTRGSQSLRPGAKFFSSAPDAPEVIERLWTFAKAGYLDNPIPSLFKERLFVYLSRFCEVRY